MASVVRRNLMVIKNTHRQKVTDCAYSLSFPRIFELSCGRNFEVAHER